MANYNHFVSESHPAGPPSLSKMERQARSLTGAAMSAVALAACYALLVLQDQTGDPRMHLYPLIAAALFYLAGDIVALIWFRLLASQLQLFVRYLEQPQQQQASRRGPGEASEEDEAESVAEGDDGVEIIKPGSR